jgi:F-type H+-transporting ATPase subunit b
MLIDWFTVGAQALNFALLAWLMKRFLYQPILQAIDAREQRIAAQIADASARKAEAQAERDEFSHKNEALARERDALLCRATEEANAERQRLLEAARTAADAAHAKRQETLRSDARDLNRAIRQRAQQEVFALARKALADLATTSLEEQLSEVFTRRLRELGGPEKEKLAAALASATDPALIRSAFDLSKEQRATIQAALNALFSTEIRLRFEAAPDLISGIELSTNGQKLTWSIADYLTTLERAVAELFDQQVAPRPAAALESDGQLVARAQ